MNNNHIKIWTNCLQILRDNLPTVSFKTWFEPIVPLKLEGSILTIQVPSPFFYEYLEEQYIDILGKILKKEIGKDAKLEYNVIIENNYHSDRKPLTNTLPSKSNYNINNPQDKFSIKPEDRSIPNPFVVPGIKRLHIDPQLNSDFTFNNFIEGECNKLARKAGIDIAQNPLNTLFNPLLIFGGSGLGKTHLVNAIGNEIVERFPDFIVLYVSANKFMTQFIESIRNKNINDFINFYQAIDVLIIDDIHEFSGKEKSQEIFFQIFNHLHQNKKQIIFTSDKPLSKLTGIENRLISRFRWGLSAKLDFPDYETRFQILKRKIYANGIELDDKILDFLASNITNNIRDLEGVLITLLAQSTLNKKTITIDLARKVVDELVKSNQKEIDNSYIIKIISDYYDIPVKILLSKSRKREIVQARQIAMYFAKHLTSNSLSNIGREIGQKDHATVLHASRTVKNLIDTDKEFKRHIEEIDHIINK